MKIGYLSTIYHTSFILKSGKFPIQSSDEILWKLYSTGPEMIKAFANNDIDLGYIGLPPVMMGIEQGIKIKCVAGGHIEGTVMISNETYNSYNELGNIESVLNQYKGKIIGTPTKGSIHDVIIRNLLKNKDIHIKNYKWADFIPDAIIDQEIDAGIGTPSLAIVASKQFNSKIIIPPNKLWPYNPSYGIVVQEDLILNSPEFITSFLKAHEDASNLIQNKPDKAASITAKEIGVVDKKFVIETYNISPRYCAKISDEYIKSTMKFLPVLKELGYMNHDLKVENIFNLEFINNIHKENAHYHI